MGRGWTTGILAAGSLAAAAQAAVTVTEPSRGLQVIAGRSYTVEWRGTEPDSEVEIDLYHCGDNCDDPESCGDFVTELCGYDQNGGCHHIFGELDVTMPEPQKKVRDGMYKVKVTDSDDSWNSGCSGAFSLRSAEDTPEHGDPDGAYLDVVSPMEADGAVAGEEYTVEFIYDNGVGSSVDRFKIDLYEALGTGDCGTWVTSICDKPDIGCKDSTGDYDVEIPLGTTPGEYKIRVGRFEDDSLFDCSGRFSVVSDSSKLDDDEVGGNRGDFYREGGYTDDDAGSEGGRMDSTDQSFSYGFYFEDDDLADDWWKNGDDSGSSSVDSRDTGDDSDDKDGGNKGGGNKDGGNKDGGNKDGGNKDGGNKHDSGDNSIDYDSVDDDGVSAGDESESPPPDDWFWGDDDWASNDDSDDSDDSSFSYSFSFSFDFDAYTW